jgi:regulatory protein
VAILARREHAAGELTRKLVERGFAQEEVVPVLEALARDGWQSDERFALAHAEIRVQRGVGPLRIREELRQRGVDSAVAGAALESLGVDWGELAAAARRKRFGEAPPADRAERARQQRFLAGRGFEAEHCRRATNDEHDRDGW